MRRERHMIAHCTQLVFYFLIHLRKPKMKTFRWCVRNSSYYLSILFFSSHKYFYWLLSGEKGLGHSRQPQEIRVFGLDCYTSRSHPAPGSFPTTKQRSPSFLFFKNIKSMATVFEVTECFGTYIWIFFSEIVFIMQVADRPGDISILTHIFVSDNRTVVLYLGAACSWK